MNHATKRVTAQYLATTSMRRGPLSATFYDSAAAGLARRLGDWAPPPKARVLDLGSGLGELIYLCRKAGCSAAVGVNLCEDENKIARAFVDADFECADILHYLSSSNEVFDWIGAMNILEHLDKDTVFEVLRLASEHLTPEGVLVAMVPNAISPFGSLTRHWDFTHEWAFTPNNFRQLAGLTGFSDDVRFRECAPVAHGPVSAVRWVLWQGIRLAILSYFMIETADNKGGVYSMDMLVRMSKRI